ncbi:MAG: bifunctional (p)ppGpp synthetase/guanosine-3',5'-bis(diphosphate) 3'-pyrophosphohydrolase [Gammaproteobacteria bacterium]|nr:bifunctional (p)ppGpp synthetase/guanosine-3',5'-bis(diphosphate) 3'-pyrophosphohydrolase [Gammaproteobacteria bacterium]
MLIPSLRKRHPPTHKPVPSFGPGRDLKFQDIETLLETYLSKQEIASIYHAYIFGYQAHAGQHRESGESYISHPVEVARILAGLHMDSKAISAAILHDVIEDTPTAKKQLRRGFGKEVAELVDGVSKLSKVSFTDQAEVQAENFRKMLMAMTRDIRVIMIKLADRLHNMRTLGAMREEKRMRIARETLEIYAPIASRLGIQAFKYELEDLSFKAIHPKRYTTLEKAVKHRRGNRKGLLKKIENAINKRLRQDGLAGKISSREKHIYGIYTKMKQKGLSFDEVFDVYAIRIVTDSVDDCYRVLGALHSLYAPIPGKFKDYIAIPKANGYQSLHTIMVSPYGVPVEVQIRTGEMNQVAEAGIAAHWLYKSGKVQKETSNWISGLLDLQKQAGNSKEFLENVKIDLFPEEVYVFTPKGKIIVLPRGSCPVDFAYAVHTDVGNTCVTARINHHYVPLQTQIRNGNTIEITTDKKAVPNPGWLNFVATAKARSSIRHHLKHLRKRKARNLGKDLLDKALHAFSLSNNTVDDERMAALLKEINLKSKAQLYQDIGLGNRMAPLVARQLAPLLDKPDNSEPLGPRSKGVRPLGIVSNEGVVIHLAKCCRPIPGDRIQGIATAGRGIVIHQPECTNISEFRNQPERLIDVQWEPEPENLFQVMIDVTTVNRRGVLATIASSLADANCNIDHVDMDDRDGNTSLLEFLISIKDLNHLQEVLKRIRSMDFVLNAKRKNT